MAVECLIFIVLIYYSRGKEKQNRNGILIKTKQQTIKTIKSKQTKRIQETTDVIQLNPHTKTNYKNQNKQIKTNQIKTNQK